MRSLVRALSRALAFVLLTTALKCGDKSPTPPTPVVTTIEVSPSSLNLVPSQTTQLSATPRDANGASIAGRTIAWSSGSSAIATVTSSGLVTAVGDGTTNVSATAEGKVGNATVVVRTPVASVTVTPTTSQITVGGAPAQLQATPRDAGGVALSGRAISWSSSSNLIATVSQSGLVTGIAAGTATITATSEGRDGTASVQVSVPDPCLNSQTVTVGQTVSGTLAASDCRLVDNTVIKKYEITLGATASLEIEMTSTVVDPYLVVTDASGNAILEDDDGGAGSNARILNTFSPGKYIIWANTFDPNSYGAYQLAIRTAPAACVGGRATGLPSAVNASLAASTACRLNNDSYMDLYALTLPAHATVRIEMTSTSINPYVAVFDAAGNLVAQDDDAGAGLNARIEVLLAPGPHLILAVAQPGETGAYRLEVTSPVDPCAVTRTLGVGQGVSGTLATTDCTLNAEGPTPFTHHWGLNVSSSVPLQIDMTSSVLDPFLIVRDASNKVVVAENDDVSAQSLNSRIIVSLPIGQYIVEASTFRFGEVGNYQLSATNIIPPQTVGISLNPSGSIGLLAGQTQQIFPTITGTANTTVTYQSANSGIATVSATGLVRGLTPGTTTITVRPQADPSKFANLVVVVTQPPTGAANLDIGALYLVQSVQSLTGTVQLVADREAVARVFLRGSRTGIGSVTVRVRIFQNSAVIGTFTGTTTPTLTVDESCCSANILIPANMIRAGISVLADADPSNTVAETNEGDNTFPVSGTAQALTVVTVPPFNLRLVPVRQNRSGLTGAASQTLANHFRSLWPIGTANVSTRQTFTVDYTLSSSVWTEWEFLVRDIELARRADGSNAYYYGLVRGTQVFGIQGLANGIPAMSAIGLDEGSPGGAAKSQTTFTHEMGHTLGLRHAPCGGAAGPDPAYPFTDGRTGSYGMDIASGNIIKTPTASDIMSYCPPNQWVSIYNYKNLMEFRKLNPDGVASPPPTSVLMVSGSVNTKGIVIDGSFAMNAPPNMNDASGRFVVEGFSAQGQILFTMRFSPFTISDGNPGNEGFVVAIPLAEAQLRQVARIEVREQSSQRAGTRTKNMLANLRQQGTGGMSVNRRPGGPMRLQWSTTDHPMLLVRDQKTGEVLAISRSGDFDLSQLGALDRVELLLSDGVSSTRHTVDPVSGAIRQ